MANQHIPLKYTDFIFFLSCQILTACLRFLLLGILLIIFYSPISVLALPSRERCLFVLQHQAVALKRPAFLQFICQVASWQIKQKEIDWKHTDSFRNWIEKNWCWSLKEWVRRRRCRRRQDLAAPHELPWSKKPENITEKWDKKQNKATERR